MTWPCSFVVGRLGRLTVRSDGGRVCGRMLLSLMLGLRLNGWRSGLAGCLGCGWFGVGGAVVGAVRRDEYSFAVPVSDLPVVVVDLVVTVPADEHHVGDVGASAFGPWCYVMGLTDRWSGAAADAASVTCFECFELSSRGAAFRVSLPEWHAF